MKYKTPYKDLLPPLTDEEKAALAEDIKKNGVTHQPVIDEDDNILDGHHRLAIDPKAKVRILAGMTDEEKIGYVLRSAGLSRNLSPEQKAEQLAKKKKFAAKWRKLDPPMSQAKIGKLLGVTQKAVSVWLGKTIPGYNASTPDARVKVQPKAKPAIAARVAKGDSISRVAACIGVTERTIRSIVSKERKAAEKKAEREKQAAKLGTDTLGVHHGDFTLIGNVVEDDSVDLIFTDPPYNEEATKDYAALAKYAARILRPGGWCLAYSGQIHLPEVFDVMAEHLTYGWTFAIWHSGGATRIRKFKVQNEWKPIVGFYKSPLSAFWDWFPDTISGGREKDEHEWQQALSEAEHFVGALCPEKGVVCDPFAGSGTSLLAAKNLGRQWVGFEKDEEHAKTARVRLND